MNNKRVYWIDATKFLCLLLVILGHHEIKESIFLAFHMPIYFWISGYLYKDGYTINETFKRAIKSYIVPYIIGTLIAAVMCSYLRKIIFVDFFKITDSYYDVLPIIGQSFGSWKGWSLFWFLPCLFTTNILFCLFRILMINKSIWCAWAMLLVANIMGVFLSYSPFPPFIGISNALVALLFTYAGYVSAHQKMVLNRILKKGIILICVACYLVEIKENIFIDMGSYKYPLYPICILGALGGIYIAVDIIKLLPKNNLISFLGRNTLIIYIVHAIEHNFIPWQDVKTFVAQTFYMSQMLTDIFTYIVRVMIILVISSIIIATNQWVSKWYRNQKMSV